ncbi:hypothetical protein [Actinomadura mexicana]|uniref:Uncharacterized protein n=1 Tax=Actinomadura mexicana TaxID=134959 RepID=A0A238X780_9ACTN|nr:hypothetical protein [Actinomadura mexicana]SNR54570.1 hypothetical protein SAMN06265355_10425 [Actinomadura mexicana]
MLLLKQLLPVVAVAFVGGQCLIAVEDDAVLSLILGVATAVLAVLVYAWTSRTSPSSATTGSRTSGRRRARSACSASWPGAREAAAATLAQ